MLSFIRNCHTVFHNGCTVFHFHQYWMRVSHPHQHLVLSALHILAILNRLTVVSHFNLHFRDDLWCGASFHRLIFHLYIFFGDVRVLGSLAIFNRVVCFLCLIFRVLCVFWMTILYQVSFASTVLPLTYAVAWFQNPPLPQGTKMWRSLM